MKKEVLRLRGVISYIAGEKLKDIEVNFDELMTLLNFQYNQVYGVGNTRTNYGARMVISSLHYLQTSIVGKVYWAHTEVARKELATYFIEAIQGYYKRMLEVHKEQIEDWLETQDDSWSGQYEEDRAQHQNLSTAVF